MRHRANLASFINKSTDTESVASPLFWELFWFGVWGGTNSSGDECVSELFLSLLPVSFAEMSSTELDELFSDFESFDIFSCCKIGIL